MTDEFEFEAESESAPRLRADDVDRDTVRSVLQTAHEQGRLDDDEVDQRRSAATAATYVDELPALIADLPEGIEPIAGLRAKMDPSSASPPTSTALEQTQPGYPGQPQPHQQPTELQPYSPGAPHASGALVPAGSGEPRQSLAVMSGKEIVLDAGRTALRNFVLMGGDEIYLREVMGPGVKVTVEIYCMWGGSDIYVPPGVRVLDESANVMGGNDIDSDAKGDGSNGTLIVKGVNFMAGNDVHLDPTIQPGHNHLNNLR